MDRCSMEGRTQEGLEEYALTLDLKVEEVIALLDAAMAEEGAEKKPA